jgi:hypothetical protein
MFNEDAVVLLDHTDELVFGGEVEEELECK